MKKLALLLAAALLLVCCLACAACSSDDTASSNPPADSTNQSSSAVPASSEPSSQDPSSESVSSEESSIASTDTPAAENLFWLTHFNDGSREGAGVIFTETDTAGPWWAHVSFAPVEGQANVYRIAEISSGSCDGSGTALDIPEGGFVYAINVGNNYPALYESDPVTYAQYANDPNYQSDSCGEMNASIKAWTVGDTIRIEGLNLSEQTLPTETPGVNWYDPSYVCTARWCFVE